MADIVLSGILGAAVLAIVLLHRAQRRDRQHLQQLRAQLAAQEVAALAQRPQTSPLPAQTPPVQPAPAPSPEPHRRKGHLALYLGGGVAALLGSIGSRARTAWKQHRALTVTATATTIAAATTAAAFYLTSSDAAPPASGSPATHAPYRPDPGDGDAPITTDTEDQRDLLALPADADTPARPDPSPAPSAGPLPASSTTPPPAGNPTEPPAPTAPPPPGQTTPAPPQEPAPAEPATAGTPTASPPDHCRHLSVRLLAVHVRLQLAC